MRERGQREHKFLQSGLPVWVGVGYVKKYDGDIDKAMDVMNSGESPDRFVTRQDLESCLSYYKKHRREIDRKLRSIANLSPRSS